MTILIFFISFLLSISSFAQPSYADAMTQGLEALHTNNLDESRTNFEQAATADPESWYPLYYMAHVDLSKMQVSEDYSEKENLLATAKANLDKAERISPNNVEIITLQAGYFGGIIQLNPRENGFTYMGTVIGLYQKALALDPENPRAHTGSISFEIGKAKFMGQSYDASCDRLQEVIKSFDSQVVKGPYDPMHGKADAQAIAKQCD